MWRVVVKIRCWKFYINLRRGQFKTESVFWSNKLLLCGLTLLGREGLMLTHPIFLGTLSIPTDLSFHCPSHRGPSVDALSFRLYYRRDQQGNPTIMGCQLSTRRIPTTRMDGYYAAADGGGGSATALTTKTFFDVGDPRSILHTTPAKQQQQRSILPSSPQYHYGLSPNILADYEVIKQISKGPASRIFLVRRRRPPRGRAKPDEERKTQHDDDVTGTSTSSGRRREEETTKDDSTMMNDDNDEYGNDDDEYDRLFVLQQLNVRGLSDGQRRQMVHDIRAIQDTHHPNSTLLFIGLFFCCWPNMTNERHVIVFCLLFLLTHL
jgi:hypothetical protein